MQKGQHKYSPGSSLCSVLDVCQLFHVELHYVSSGISVSDVDDKDQRPAVKEKLAASLILLRAAFLLGLSMDRGLFMPGGDGGLVIPR